MRMCVNKETTIARGELYRLKSKATAMWFHAAPLTDSLLNGNYTSPDGRVADKYYKGYIFHYLGLLKSI